jgi:hypothetical protein
MSFVPILLILVGVYIIGSFIYLIFWSEIGSKTLIKKIEASPCFVLTKPKELRPSKKGFIFLIMGDCISLFCILLIISLFDNIPSPAIAILLGFVMIFIYFNVKYFSVRIIISSTGVSRVDIFHKTHIAWPKIESFRFFPSFPGLWSIRSIFIIPIQLGYFGHYFLLAQEKCIFYRWKNKILFPPGINERNILIKTIIQNAGLKLVTQYSFGGLEWVKPKYNTTSQNQQKK